MRVSNLLLLVALTAPAALTLLAQPAAGLSCYLCNSTIQSDCLEEFNYNSRTVVPAVCDVADGKFCIKTTGVWGAVVGTTRFCSSMDMGDQCQYLPFPDHNRIYRACVYTCSSDGCNSAPPLLGGCWGAGVACLAVLGQLLLMQHW